MENLGKRVTILRTLARLSVSELGAKAGMRATLVSAIEASIKLPTPTQLERIASACASALDGFATACTPADRTKRLVAVARDFLEPTTLGKRLRALRIAQRHTAGQMAKAIRKSGRTVFRYEWDDGNPSLSDLRACAAYGRVSLAWLVDGDCACTERQSA